MTDAAAVPLPETPRRKRLSVAMIVRDESILIAGAIASVQGLADEIVVVDTGSTDDTAAQAAALGARVVHSPWADDFAAARNVSVAHCQGDWVLILDADERLLEASHAALQALVAVPATRAVAYAVRIRNWTDEAHRFGFEHRGVRLFARLPGIAFTGRVHEQLHHRDGGEAAIAWHQAPDVTIEHLGYAADVVVAKGKDARNLDLLGKCITAEPTEPFHRFNLGLTHWAGGRYPEALQAMAEAIRLAEPLGRRPDYIGEGYIIQMACHVAMDHPRQALAVAATCESLCAGGPDYWYLIGLAWQAVDQHDTAITALQRCLDRRDAIPCMTQLGTDGWRAWLAIAVSQTRLNDQTACLDAWWEALTLHGRLPDVHGDFWAQAFLAKDAQRTEAAVRFWSAEADPGYQAGVVEHAWDEIVQRAGMSSARQWALPLLTGMPLGARLGLLMRLSALETGPEAQAAFLEPFVTEPGVAPLLGQLYLETGRWDAYERLCLALVAEGREQAFAHFGLGNLRFRQGDAVGAEGALRQAAAHDGNEPNVWHLLGLVALAQQRVEAAEAHFRQAVTLRPDHIAANLNLVRTAWWRKQPDVARSWLSAAMGALSAQLDRPPNALTAGALRDFEALNQYFHRWNLASQSDPQIPVPHGTEVLLSDLAEAWRKITLRQLAP